MTSPYRTIDPARDEALLGPVGDLGEARRHVEAAMLPDPEREPVRSEMLDFCDRHPDALHRTCLDGHLTGSAVVVDPRSRRTLLIHHAKLDRWLQPGGHADGDGNLAAVAWREASEETGLDDLHVVLPAIDLDIHTIPARGDEPTHVHLDVRFLVLAAGALDPNPNAETLGAGWFDATADPVSASDELRRAVRHALSTLALLSGEG